MKGMRKGFKFRIPVEQDCVLILKRRNTPFVHRDLSSDENILTQQFVYPVNVTSEYIPANASFDTIPD